MSKEINLDIRITSFKDKSIRFDIMKIMYDNGWSFTDNGKFTYLPIGDDDYCWESNNLSDDEIFTFLKEKSKLDEVLGVSITWRDTNIGGQILFFTDFQISFSINNNIKYTELGFIDVNWYLEKILPILNNNNIFYENLLYQELI